jgi:hypothetical protein
MKEDVTCYRHGVLQIAFDFIKDIFGGAAEQNCAGLGISTFGDEGKVSRNWLATRFPKKRHAV